MEVNRHRLWGVVILVIIALILAFMFGEGELGQSPVSMEVMPDESPLTQCYMRCQRSILSFEWCAQACRCALGYDICSTGGQLVWVRGETK